VVWPAVIGLPGNVRTLKNNIGRALVPYDENDIALYTATQGRKFAQVNAAHPIIRDPEARTRFPLALTQSISPYRRLGLRFPSERSKTLTSNARLRRRKIPSGKSRE
jgi:DNA-binding NtrC family response regulator